jgi:hypothetical protein
MWKNPYFLLNQPSMNTSTVSAPDSALETYERVAAASNEVAGLLAKRLKSETQGEVLFSAADRGRYDRRLDLPTNAHGRLGAHQQPRCGDRAGHLPWHGRALWYPVAAAPASAVKPWAWVWSSTTASICANFAPGCRARTVTVEPGIVLDHLNAALKPHGLWFPVDVSTSAKPLWAAWRATTPAAAAPLPTATWCTTFWGPKLGSAMANCSIFPIAQSHGRAERMGHFVQTTWPINLRPEIDAHWPRVLRRVAGYNLDVFHPKVRPYTDPTVRSTWPICWWAAKAPWP